MEKRNRADHPGEANGQAPKLDFSKIGKSKRLAKQNKDYLDLLSIIDKARRGMAIEQSNLKSRPAKDAATQLLRQLDLISNMLQLPYVILMMMEGHASGWEQAFEIALRHLTGLKTPLRKTSIKGGPQRKLFETHARRTMQRFFALDASGSLSRPWLFAVTLYTWTAYECLAADLWAASLNQTTSLGHRILNSVGSEDTEKLGLSRRQIDVGLAARYGFDLRHSLGTILKSKFDFSSFRGIEGAYKQAFGTCGELDDGQRDTLKELEQMRHLIVHRGGVADSKFVKFAKLRARQGKVVSLKLAQVGYYMMSATMGCVELLHVVDGWFASQESLASASNDSIPPAGGTS